MLPHHHPKKASRYLGFKRNTIMTAFTWHSHYRASMIFNIIDQMLSAVEEAGDIIEATEIMNIEGETVRLPFFLPKTNKEKKC